MKINRNLKPGMLEHYADLLEQGVLPEELGSYHKVSFTGEDAIKSPIYEDPATYERFRKSLFDEYNKAIELEEIGFNIVKMRGAYLVEREIPFLVMKTENLVGYYRLTKSERKIFDKQFDNQRNLAKSHGWVSDDFDNYKQFNCGFDRTKQRVVFIDAEDWRKK